MCYSCDDSDKMTVCEKHAWNVIKSHVAQKVLVETSKQAMFRKEFIHDVLVASVRTSHHGKPAAKSQAPGSRSARMARRLVLRRTC